MADNTRLPVKQDKGELRRRDAFEIFNAMQAEMDRFWRDPFRFGTLAFPFGRVTRSIADFVPRMDVYEQDKTIVIKTELPGLKKDDVQVELDDDALVIRGQSQAEKELNEDAYYRTERSSGSFYRRVPLPFEIQPEQIQASLADGVLEVRIPRPASSQTEPKRIPVTSADSVDGPSNNVPSNSGPSEPDMAATA